MGEYLSNRKYAAMETRDLEQIERTAGCVHSQRAARELRKRAKRMIPTSQSVIDAALSEGG